MSVTYDIEGSTPGGTTPTSGGGGGGSCPYSKDNVSSGEYQAKIPMPSGTSPPYTVVITFDADTTIVLISVLHLAFPHYLITGKLSQQLR